MQSVANLAAIALERARGQDAITRAEAARHSGELRATLLDAVAHEFKTPLTSVKAAASALAEKLPAGASEHELATIIGEESDRLEGLVNDATQVLRLESGDFRLRTVPSTRSRSCRADDCRAQRAARRTDVRQRRHA